MYSGCSGNENNFASNTECMDVCMNSSLASNKHGFTKGVEYVTVVPRLRSDCNKPIKRGICAGSLKMYGYDMVLAKCRNFTYTGCAGNSNRFFTLSSCKSVCERSRIIPHPYARRPGKRYNLIKSYYKGHTYKGYENIDVLLTN